MIFYVYNPFWPSTVKKTKKKYEAENIKKDVGQEKNMKVEG
jgi:hypothetical protein